MPCGRYNNILVLVNSISILQKNPGPIGNWARHLQYSTPISNKDAEKLAQPLNNSQVIDDGDIHRTYRHGM